MRPLGYRLSAILKKADGWVLPACPMRKGLTKAFPSAQHPTLEPHGRPSRRVISVLCKVVECELEGILRATDDGSATSGVGCFSNSQSHSPADPKPFRTDRMERDFTLLNGFTDATISSVTIFGRGTDDIEHWTCGWVRGLIPP